MSRQTCYGGVWAIKAELLLLARGKLEYSWKYFFVCFQLFHDCNCSGPFFFFFFCLTVSFCKENYCNESLTQVWCEFLSSMKAVPSVHRQNTLTWCWPRQRVWREVGTSSTVRMLMFQKFSPFSCLGKIKLVWNSSSVMETRGASLRHYIDLMCFM